MLYNDLLECPIVGTNYTNYQKDLTFGSLCTLAPEPTNLYDANAVAVFDMDEVKIGYLPNRGNSCADCYNPVKKNTNCCSVCGCFDSVKGGFAFRHLRMMRQCDVVCYIIEPKESYDTYWIKIIYKEKD